VRVAAEGHGGRHAPRPAAGREQAFLVAQVALELGDEVADDGGEPGEGHGLFSGGRPGEQLGCGAQPDVIPGQPGRGLGGDAGEQQRLFVRSLAQHLGPGVADQRRQFRTGPPVVLGRAHQLLRAPHDLPQHEHVLLGQRQRRPRGQAGGPRLLPVRSRNAYLSHSHPPLMFSLKK
jgi:hypothetical protein